MYVLERSNLTLYCLEWRDNYVNTEKYISIKLGRNKNSKKNNKMQLDDKIVQLYLTQIYRRINKQETNQTQIEDKEENNESIKVKKVITSSTNKSIRKKERNPQT